MHFVCKYVSVISFFEIINAENIKIKCKKENFLGYFKFILVSGVLQK